MQKITIQRLCSRDDHKQFRDIAKFQPNLDSRIVGALSVFPR